MDSGASPRHCQGCGKDLARHAGETSGKWRRRRHCDRACVGRRSRSVVESPHPPCVVCGGPVTRRVWGCGKSEAWTLYEARQTCGQACGMVFSGRLRRGRKRPRPDPAAVPGPETHFERRGAQDVDIRREPIVREDMEWRPAFPVREVPRAEYDRMVAASNRGAGHAGPGPRPEGETC